MHGGRGVTLVELMVALGLFAMLSISVIAVTFQVRSMSEQVVYQNTALTLAQGYMEQIRHLDYTTLQAAAVSNTVAIPLDQTTGAAVTAVAGGIFRNGSTSREIIYLDQNAQGTPIQPLTFQFTPTLVSLEALSSPIASGVEITIDYQITYNFGVTRTIRGALRSARSSVPTY